MADNKGTAQTSKVQVDLDAISSMCAPLLQWTTGCEAQLNMQRRDFEGFLENPQTCSGTLKPIVEEGINSLLDTMQSIGTRVATLQNQVQDYNAKKGSVLIDLDKMRAASAAALQMRQRGKTLRATGVK